MAFDDGYGALENEIVELFQKGTPDFIRAEEIIQKGADLNASGKDPQENMLSEILSGYWDSAFLDTPDDACENCETEHCDQCEYHPNLNPNVGESMCAIIQFFLDHGFDVQKNDGCYGAQCLNALTLSSFDKYMIQAAKILLDAGACNRTISPASTKTPCDRVATEQILQEMSGGDHALANIYEALYQLYASAENGQSYHGIDSYEMAIGHQITRVLAAHSGNGEVFYRMDVPGFVKDNCYTSTLYFELDNCVLVSTEDAHFWTDREIQIKSLTEVSDKFPGIIGGRIQSFDFSERIISNGTTQFCQPIATIKMDNGHQLRISMNFGEVPDEQEAAFFTIT